MPKFSVKKPLTVFVGVILILVLGVVSFMGMSTDLLPNMQLPYVIAVTAYPGASPEKVETAVSKPIESALSTANGMKNITSVSNENMSMVIMEFEQDTNMDSAMIELSNSINAVSGQFDDSVGTPTLIKMSPDLLPIMVAGVDREGYDEKELSEFVNNNIITELYKADGVASVEATGLTEEKISVRLNGDKLDRVNDKLLKTVNSELYKAKLQITNGLNKIENGEKKLKDAQVTADKKSAEGAKALSAASAQADAAAASVAAMKSKGTLLAADKKALEAELSGMKKLNALKQPLHSLADGIVQSVFAEKMPEISGLPTEEQQAEAAKVKAEMDEALKDSAEFIRFNLTDSQFKTLYAAVISAAGSSAPAEMKSLNKAEFLNMLSKADKAQTRIAAINSELDNIATQSAVLDAMKPQLLSGEKKAADAYKMLESKKLSASAAIALGNIKISESRQQLSSARNELLKAQNEYEASRDKALKAADLSGSLTADAVAKLLSAQNFSMPAGSIDKKGLEKHVVKVDGGYNSLSEIKNTILMHVGKGGVKDIRVKDVAQVKITDNAGDSYAKINSNPAILFTVQKQSTASTSDVSDALRKKIEELKSEYSGLSITPLMDQGTYIHIVINSVLQNLLWGGLLAVLVLALFLRDVKPTVIIAFSIPISLLFAVALMYFTNVTLNVISLSGLALGVGMLVDNSIVVIENIYRLRNQGVSALRAAVMGAKEVAGAITASTLTTICVFVPIVFTHGISREIFTDMGLTIGYSLAASLLVALTVVPAMGSRLLKSNKPKKHRAFDAVVDFYEKILRAGLRHKAVVIGLAVVLLGFSVYEAARMGTAFIPESEQSQLQATTEFPEGYTRKQARDAADELISRIKDIDGVSTVGAMEAASGLSSMSAGSAGKSISYYIELDKNRKLSNADISDKITQAADKYGCETTVSGSNMSMSSLGDAGIKINITGDELETVYKLGDELAKKLENVEGLENISNGRSNSDTQTVISLDRAKAMKYGLTTAQVYQQIAGRLSGKVDSATVTLKGRDYPIVVMDSADKVTMKNLADQKISYTDRESGETKTVALKSISQNEEKESPDSIKRVNSQRTLAVTAQVDSEHNIGLLSRDVEKILSETKLPDGYSAEIAGENETITTAFGDLLLMLLLAVVFIYLIMVAQFQSLISPFIVIFTIPLAITGGLLGLWITGSELSVVALIGFLVLAGVVVNNGIVFVDYTNKLREQGIKKREALVQTGRTRIRPILMTALTTILAMITMALGIGEGADMTAPVGIVVIGGLSYATLLTLFVVPVLYEIFGKKKMKKLDLGNEDDLFGAEGEDDFTGDR